MLPLVIERSQQTTWLEIMEGIHYEPSDAAVIEELKDHYGLYGIPEGLKGTSQKIYLVYSLCWPSDE